jgi:hypothetical protein
VITPDDVEGSIRPIRAICPVDPAHR